MINNYFIVFCFVVFRKQLPSVFWVWESDDERLGSWQTEKWNNN